MPPFPRIVRPVKRMLLVLVALGLVATLVVDARSVEWRQDRYSLFASNQDLGDTLRDFCAAQGVAAVISPGITGTVSGRFEDMHPARFLDLMAGTYALTWYHDGHALFIYRADETQSRMIRLMHVGPDRLKTTLVRLALWDNRFAWRTVEKEGLVHVSGPPRLVQLVEETARYLESGAVQEMQATEAVRVFPLRHAWADDLTLKFLKREVVVPGVASTLRAIMTDQPGTTGRMERRLPTSLAGLRGTGLAAREPGEALVQEGGTSPADQGSAQGGMPSAPQTAVNVQARIMADTRLNAVVVRDSQEKMPLYEALIRELDVAVGVIEIQAAIIDVDVNFSRDLGVNWSFASSPADKFSVAGGFEAGEGFKPDALSTLVQGQGMNLATLYAGGAYHLLARIHALQSRGNAQILSRPTVLTLDNVEAHIEHTRKIHVRLQGERNVDLVPVDTGTVLEVTPRIIEEEGRKRIKLLVSIRDGSYSQTSSVDDIPEIIESVVSTQAVMELGQSLLLGGYYVQQTKDNLSGVPLLMDIPLLGPVFKTTKKEERTMERLFLISPRIVEMDVGHGLPLGPPEGGGSTMTFLGDVPGMPGEAPSVPVVPEASPRTSMVPMPIPAPASTSRPGGGCTPVRRNVSSAPRAAMDSGRFMDGFSSVGNGNHMTGLSAG